MTVSVNEQTLIFFSCVLAGVIIGLVFDVFRIIRKAYKLNKIYMALSDFVFWMLAILIVFTTIYITGDGVIRWFVFLGCGIGFLFYLLTISPMIVKTIVKIIQWINHILWNIIRFILKPFALIVRFFGKKTTKIRKFVKSAQKKSGENMKKRLAKLRKIGIILRKV